MKDRSSLESAKILVDGLCARGLQHFVTSPGSRNAPLIRAAAALESAGLLTLHQVLDERSAAHFALGLGQSSGRPAVVCCTSGTAVANLGPAIIEAARSSAPLIALTADRPAELHNRGESQTISQANLHVAHCRSTFTWPSESAPTIRPQLSDTQLSDAQLDDIWLSAQCGPVHVNVPLGAPLYADADADTDTQAQNPIGTSPFNSDLSNTADRTGPWANSPAEFPADIAAFAKILKHARRDGLRVLWMLGGDHRKLSAAVSSNIEKNDVVLSDLHAGLCTTVGLHSVDRLMKSTDIRGDWPAWRPDLLVTAGSPFISKSFRDQLHGDSIAHWHIDPAGQAPDITGSLEGVICAELELVLQAIGETEEASQKARAWSSRWTELNAQLESEQSNELKTIAAELQSAPAPTKPVDFQVFQALTGRLKDGWAVHWGNSTAIRYAHWLGHHWAPGVLHYANRGAAGIEGSTSTAMGQAAAKDTATTKAPFVLVCGDLSFLYDAGAWTARPLPRNFKALVINNGGGGIFRWLDGPQRMPSFERDIEAQHELSILPLLQMHGVQGLQAETFQELTQRLDEWLAAERPVVLEVLTDGVKSGEIFRRVCDIFAH